MNTWLRYCLLRPLMVWHKSIVPSWLPRHWNSSGHTQNHITCRAQLVLPKDSACLCLHPWHLHCSEWRRRRRHLPCEVVNINWFIIHQYKFVLSLSQSHLANPTHSHSKMSVIIKTLTMVISGRWYHENFTLGVQICNVNSTGAYQKNKICILSKTPWFWSDSDDLYGVGRW